MLNGIQNNETHGLPLDIVSNKQYNIYLDYYSTEGFTITNNTAAFSQGGAGIMLHGSQNVVIRNNTVFDCAVGIRLQELDGLGYPSRNVIMENNVVIAKSLSQVCVLARSTTNDFNQYGTFTNNYYAKPINNFNAFATLLNTWTNAYHNFSGWQTYTSLDASSHMSGQTITNVNELQFEYNSTESQQTLSLSQPMIDAKDIKYSSGITLQPFSSAVLMKDKNPILSQLTKPVITTFIIPENSATMMVPITNFTVVSNQTVTGYKLTESSNAPLASDAGWTTTVPTSFTFTSLGIKTLYAWAKDATGNVSASANAKVIIQKNLGYTEIYSTTTTSTARSAMPVTITETGEIYGITIYHDGGIGNLILGVYSDQSGFPSSRLGITNSIPINSSAGWQTVSLTNPVPVISGQKVWLSWVFQNNPKSLSSGTPGRAASSGYWATGMPSSFGASTISNLKLSIYCNYLPENALPDVTKPVVTAFSIPTTSSSLIVPISNFSASDNKGVTGYMLTESATAPLASNSGWNASAPVSYYFASEGTKTLYAWAKDAAGNISSRVGSQVIITVPVNNEIILGNTDVYSNTSNITNLMAIPLTFTEAGEIKSISIYHNGGTGNLLLGVYSDQSGYPLTRLGVTTSTSVNSTAGWQTIQLTTNVPVVSGQKVWLSWVFQNNPGIRYVTGTPGRASSSNTWANGMPVTFGTSTISNSKYSIYCTYTSPNNPTDLTAPVVDAFSIPATSSSLTVTITNFTASDNKGVTGYLLTETSTPPLVSGSGWSAVSPVSFTFTSEGTNPLRMGKR